MAKPARESICHVTDAGGVVHLARVARQMTKDHKVIAFNVATACSPRVVSWNAKLDGDGLFPGNLPEGFDLPKKVAGCGMLVKYEPESLLAPPVTCVTCSAMSDFVDVWRR